MGRWIGLALGLALFGWVLSASDLAAVWLLLRDFRWRFGWVLAFYLVVFGLDTLGWKYALSSAWQGRVPLNRLFRARLAGEAVNYVTPSAWIGGEPVKALLLSRRHGVPLSEGMSSVVAAKTTFAFGMLLFVLIGVAVTLVSQPVSAALMRWVWIILPILTGLLLLFLGLQFLQPFLRGGSLFGRVFPRWFERFGHRLREWDTALLAIYRRSPRSLLCSLGFHFLGWVAGALEVFLILRFLQIPVSFGTAFSIEALWVLLKTGAVLIPASLGASEGIALLVCGGLGVSGAPGLALGLIRRARELVWVGWGLFEAARR